MRDLPHQEAVGQVLARDACHVELAERPVQHGAPVGRGGVQPQAHAVREKAARYETDGRSVRPDDERMTGRARGKAKQTKDQSIFAFNNISPIGDLEMTTTAFWQLTLC